MFIYLLEIDKTVENHELVDSIFLCKFDLLKFDIGFSLAE